MSGRVGKGRFYRLPSRTGWLRRKVGKAKAEGREPASSVLEELRKAEEVAQRMEREVVRNRGENQLERKDRKSGGSVATEDFGLKLIAEFDGDSLSAAIARIEAKMRGDMGLSAAIATCPKKERRRFQLAIWLFSKVLPKLRVGLSQVSTVKIHERLHEGGFRVNIVKQSGKTERGDFAGP